MAKIDHSFRPLQLIQGGVEDDFPITKPAQSGPKDEDWLRQLPIKTRFLSKLKMQRSCLLENYGVLEFTEKAALLYNFLPLMGNLTHMWVDTAIFSRDNVLVEVINPPEEEDVNEQYHLPVSEPRQEHD